LPPLAPPGLFSTRSSMVSGTESLISLHRIKPSTEVSHTIFAGKVPPTPALVEKLHGIGWNREEVADVLVACKDLATSARREKPQR
jgi:hypothetical protein